MSGTPGLLLGSLDLLGRDDLYDGYKIEMLGDESSWGNPAAVEVALKSLLQDGSIVVTQGYDNREVTFRVEVNASDGLALAQAEAALVGEVGKRNTLTYTPVAELGPATVFDVITSSLEHVANDFDENRLVRTYGLRLVCEPFGRSVDEVVVPAVFAAPPVTPTTVTVADGTTAANWNGYYSTTTVTSDGSVVSTNQDDLMGLRYVPTTSADMSVTDMFYVDWKIQSTAGSAYVRHFNAHLTTTQGDYDLQPLATAVAPLTGFTRTYYQSPVTSIVAFKFDAYAMKADGTYAKNLTLKIDGITRTNVAPASGTARQQYGTIEVAGSARTQASLAIEYGGAVALDDTIVYTWPDDGSGYLPPLRPYWVSGSSVVVDSTLVSGGKNLLDTAQVFDIPVAKVPNGSYLLVVRVNTTSSGTQSIDWTATGRMGGSDVGPTVSGSTLINFASAGPWQYVVLGRISLPPAELGQSGSVRITIVADDAARSDIYLDEGWLFNTSIGALTVVDCKQGAPAAGGPSNRLWIDSATLDHPLPGVYRGYSSDRSDSVHAASDALSWAIHNFEPPSVNIFVVTTGVLNASASARFYPRWFTHAGQ